MNPQLENFFSKSSWHRCMSSRLLGTDTEDIKDSLRASEIESDWFLITNGQKNLDNEEFLSRSVIGVTSSSSAFKLHPRGDPCCWGQLSHHPPFRRPVCYI